MAQSCSSNPSTSSSCQSVAFGGFQDSLEQLATFAAHAVATSVQSFFSSLVDLDQLENIAPSTTVLTLGMVMNGKTVRMRTQLP